MDQGGWIFLFVTNCISLAGLCYAWHRVHVLKKELGKYKEYEDHGRKSVSEI